MARKREDDLVGMLSCAVCFGEYDENCATIPRIFPCSHTICESCIKELINNDNTLVCPICRKKHKAESKEKSFPLNKYPLVLIRKNKEEAIRKNKEEAIRKNKEEAQSKEKCKQHGKEVVIYCKEEMCRKAVCLSCWSVDHKKHEVIVIEEEEQELLMRKLCKIKTNLEVKAKMISNAKNYVADKTNTCVRELKKKEKEIKKMIQEAETQGTKSIEKADEELAGIGANIDLVTNIINNKDGASHVNDNETIQAIMRTTRKIYLVLDLSNSQYSMQMHLQKLF